MLVAQDFRDRARAALSGKWAAAVGTGFVASLLGAGTAFISGGSGGGSSSANSESLDTMLSEIPSEVLNILMVVIMLFLGIVVIWSLVLFIIGGPITLGYIKYNLGLVDGEQVDIKDLFSQFHRFGDGFLVQFLRNLYVVLWMLLFMVPGFVIGLLLAAITGTKDGFLLVAILGMVIGMIPAIIVGTIKEYSYSMAPYILYEHSEMSANQAIKESKQLMEGNKWRFFCLGISFIGWALLCVLTCGIGSLWLKPYQEAAYAAFYREICAERYGRPDEYITEAAQGDDAQDDTSEPQSDIYAN